MQGSFLKICVGLAIIIASLSVAYYFLILVPKLESQKLQFEKQKEEQRKREEEERLERERSKAKEEAFQRIQLESCILSAGQNESDYKEKCLLASNQYVNDPPVVRMRFVNSCLDHATEKHLQDKEECFKKYRR